MPDDDDAPVAAPVTARTADSELLFRPEWLDGAVGPSGNELPEGFEDPDWYHDQEAAKRAAARLAPQWLDLSVFDSGAAELPASTPSAGALLPPIGHEEDALLPADGGGAVGAGDLLHETVAEEPIGYEVNDEASSAGAPATTTEPASAAAEQETPSEEPEEPVGSPELTYDMPSQSAPDLTTSPAFSASSAADSAVRQSVSVQAGEEETAEPEVDPYRPRFSVAPKSVQYVVVLEALLAMVNVAAAAVALLAILTSTAGLTVPFLGLGLSGPLLVFLFVLSSAAALAAVMSVPGLARGEQTWWKAAFLPAIVAFWCLPLALAAIVLLLRPDTKDWVI